MSYSYTKSLLGIKHFFTLLFVISWFNGIAQIDDIWVHKSDFGYNSANVPDPIIRQDAVCFSIEGKGYVGTGEGGDYNHLKDFWEYDPDLNIWTPVATDL